MATLTLRKPVPTGVVIGPFSATRVLRMDWRTCSGSGVPYSAITFSPACWTSQSNSTPVASRTRTLASLISGPTPSPGMRVTAWRATARLLLEVVVVDLDELCPLRGHLVLREDRVHRAGVHAGAAVDALVRIDEVHVGVVVGVDAVDGADLHAGGVLHPDAGLGDDVCHSKAILGPSGQGVPRPHDRYRHHRTGQSVGARRASPW